MTSSSTWYYHYPCSVLIACCTITALKWHCMLYHYCFKMAFHLDTADINREPATKYDDLHVDCTIRQQVHKTSKHTQIAQPKKYYMYMYETSRNRSPDKMPCLVIHIDVTGNTAFLNTSKGTPCLCYAHLFYSHVWVVIPLTPWDTFGTETN